jgi:uncharacterized protein YukE
MSDELDRLQDLQDDIHDAHGGWGANELAEACAAAAAVPTFGGDADALRLIADDCRTVVQSVQKALDAADVLREKGISDVWAGDTHVTANDALRALADDMFRALTAFRQISDQVRQHAELVQQEPGDRGNAASLAEIATTVGAMSWGPVPNLEYEGEVMRAQHAQAIAHIDGRVDKHIAMRNAAEDFATALHEIETQARTGRLSDSPLSAVDEVVIAGAGWTRTMVPLTPVLTPAMDQRAAEALAALNDEDRERMTGLLATAYSPEHRAYLLKTLAAGYSVGEVAGFDQLIAGHGDDPGWLREHLSPLSLDVENPTPGTQSNRFGAAEWQQGPLPTCVASSTVTARAQVDPLYALQLTTGGHPGDPQFDNPAAFADRLRDEQVQVYDDGRDWRQKTFHDAGMTDEQSETIANEEIAPRAGVRYEDVQTRDAESRASVLPQIERAVDEGRPVPLSVDEGPEGHQLLVIGHSGNQLQIYNPWGYTYWITEREFTDGHVDAIDPEVPREPTAVRLPAAAGR